MMRSRLGLALLALLAAGLADAAPLAKNATSSATTRLSLSAVGDLGCAVEAGRYQAASDPNAVLAVTPAAYAAAAAYASGFLSLGWFGEATLSLTRSGNNGAVHHIDVQGALGAGRLYALVSTAGTGLETSLDAWSSSEALAFAEAAAESLLLDRAGLDIEVFGDADPLVSRGGGIGANADSTGLGAAYAFAESGAQAANSSAGYSEASGTDLAAGFGTVSVHGANIKRFEAGLALFSGSMMAVDVNSYAASVASAYATAITSAVAEARALAIADAKAEFCYQDIPFLDDDCIEIFSLEDDADAFAEAIAESSSEIHDFAAAYANAYARVVAQSAISIAARAKFENRPGTKDLLSLTGEASAKLICNEYAEASASAEIVQSSQVY